MKKVLALFLTFLILSTLTLAVFADNGETEPTSLPSPEQEGEYHIEIIYEVEEEIPDRVTHFVVQEGDNFTFIIRDVDGYTYDRFDIEGNYQIVSQDGRTITIHPYSDLVIHIRFVGQNPQPKPDDNGNTSPHTGDNTALLLSLMALGLCGAVIATKKLVKTR